MFPEALIAHQIHNRIRLKIPACKGDMPFFADVCAKLVGLKQFEHVESNVTTGSVLLVKEGLDVNQLAHVAAEEKLFHLIPEEIKPVPLAEKVTVPMKALSHEIRDFTGRTCKGQFYGSALVYRFLVFIWNFHEIYTRPFCFKKHLRW